MSQRTVIVDGNPILRFALNEILKNASDLQIVGEASRCADACPVISRQRPDLVLFDLELEDGYGADVIRRFRKRFPSLRAVIYTAVRDPQIVAEALACGIQGYVLKTSPNECLLDAVEHVAAGRAFLDPDITATVLAQVSHTSGATPVPTTLSQREHAVLVLLAAGKRNKEIASLLEITERTVKFHVSAILRHLKAQNRTEAVQIADRLHLLPQGTGSSGLAA
jgi:DNA-binding NarL/FixJ family response regulator